MNVSIIIPAYNEGATIQTVLKAVAAVKLIGCFLDKRERVCIIVWSLDSLKNLLLKKAIK